MCPLQGIKQEREEQFEKYRCCKQQSPLATLLPNIDNITPDGLWHHTMLQPAFLRAPLPGQPIPAALQNCEQYHIQASDVQSFCTSYSSLLEGMTQALNRLATDNVLFQLEGLQLAQAAKVIAGGQYGFASTEMVCFDNDILACAFMRVSWFSEAVQLLEATIVRCNHKYGNNSLVSIQCQRNLAQAKQHESMYDSLGQVIAADLLRQAIAGSDAIKPMQHASSEALAVRAALRFDLVEVYMKDDRQSTLLQPV